MNNMNNYFNNISRRSLLNHFFKLSIILFSSGWKSFEKKNEGIIHKNISSKNYQWIFPIPSFNKKNILDSTIKIKGLFSESIKVSIISEKKNYVLFKKNFNKIGDGASRDRKKLLLDVHRSILIKKQLFVLIESSSKHTKRSPNGSRKKIKTKINSIEFNPILTLDNIEIKNNSVIEGYVKKDSFYASEKINVFVHSLTKNFKYILKDEISNRRIKVKNNQNGFKQNFKKYSSMTGLNWLKTFTLTENKNLKSSLYSLSLINKNHKFKIPIIIKNKNHVSDFGIVIQTNTIHAYNDWGGGSFYKYLINDNTKRSITNEISKDRPIYGAFSSDHLLRGTLPFLKWAHQNGYNFEILADNDLSKKNKTLNKIKTLVFVSHSEYWTPDMYKCIENFTLKGGNLISLSGNIAFYKTLENKRILISRKDESYHLNGQRGGYWHLLNKPASKVFGTKYDSSGYNTFAPYEVLNPNHWVFKGLNLKKGDLIGNFGKGASGSELDKIDKFSPKNLIHLATGKNKYNGTRVHGADMIYYENQYGSKIFSTGSITSVHKISEDKTIQKIVKNVLDRFI